MAKGSFWVTVLLALTLGVAGCGDDGGGGDGGSAATGGSGGTSGSGGSSSGGDACTVVCNSPCAGILPGTPDGSIQQCIDQCQAVGLFDGCDTQTANFINCLEENDCPEVGAECAGQAQAFGQCFAGF